MPVNYAATATIHTAALQHNLSVIRDRAPGARIMAMVKANAYGHGLAPVARALGDADSLAVARVDAARALRDAGISAPIVLLEGVFDQEGLNAALALDCELVVHTGEQIDLLRAAPADAAFIVWLKIDSGMNRLGFVPTGVPAALASLRELAQVREVRLISHYASADVEDGVQNAEQRARLQPVLAAFDGAISLANSPAALRADSRELIGADRSTQLWLRPGIALYGISPFAGQSAASLGLRPVMDFDTRLIAIRELKAGDKVGYGGRYTAAQACRIGIAAAGYGDGYPRGIPDGTAVLVNGLPARIAGRVSMDMLSIDLGDIPDARIGSPVRLWGEGLPPEQIADAAGTIAYELVTRVSERVHRVYRR